MSRLYGEPFSSAHDQFAQVNRQIQGDTEVTRLRTYFVSHLAQMALYATSRGAFLTAGVSFAVAPKVTSAVVNFASTGRSWILIDPFDGRGDTRYNTDFVVAQDGWSTVIPTTWVQLPLVQAVSDWDRLEEWGTLSFVHLNTTDFSSELAVLAPLSSRMESGAIMVIDLYGWECTENQRAIDEELRHLGLLSWELPSLQLVVVKP